MSALRILATTRAVLLASLAATACSPSSAATRTFPVGGFDRVAHSAPVDVRVHVGPAPSARAAGPQEVIDRLILEVRDGELVVRTKPGRWFGSWGAHGRTQIDVTVPALRGASVSGPGNLQVDRVRAQAFTARLSGPGDLSVASLEASSVEATLSGPGDLTLAGHAASGRLTLSGPGDIRAAGLMLRDADVSLSGPGDIALSASGMVRGRLNGPGDITVTGGARCDISKSGPGDVHCR